MVVQEPERAPIMALHLSVLSIISFYKIYFDNGNGRHKNGNGYLLESIQGICNRPT